MINVYINKIAAYLPNKAVDNDSIENVLGQIGPRTSRAKRIILKTNKIKTRFYAIDPVTRQQTHNNTELTANAVKKLNTNLDNIDVLACGTTIPDQIMPNHAIMVHGELGMKPLEVVSTSGICLSGVTALKYAYNSIKSGDANLAIATGSENVSSAMRAENFNSEIESRTDKLETNPEIAFGKDFLRWMLSDGAGAVELSNKPNSNSISIKINKIFSISFANEIEACMYAGADKLENGYLKGWREYTPQAWLDSSIFSIKQDVKLLNEFITDYTVQKPLEMMLAKNMFKPDDIDWFLPHYSSNYFRDEVYEKMKNAGCDIPQDKWFTNLSTKGNTGSASIYIMLEEIFNSGKLKKGQKMLCYIPESGRFSTAFMLLEVV